MGVFKSKEENSAIRAETPSSKYEFMFTSREQILNLGAYVNSPTALSSGDGQQIRPASAQKLNADEFRIFAQDGQTYWCRRRKDDVRIEVFLESQSSRTAFVERPQSASERGYSSPASSHSNVDAPLASCAPRQRNYHGISVRYDPQGKIADALDLLKSKSPTEFATIAKHLRAIEVYDINSNQGGDWCANQVYQTNDHSYGAYSVKQLAYTIAHEAKHAADQAQNFLQPSPSDSPQEAAKKSTELERRAFGFEADVMENCGENKYTVQHWRIMSDHAGKHWDENGDGLYTREDTGERLRKKREAARDGK